MDQPSVPPGVRLGVVRGISYGLFGRPDRFVAPARGLGAGVLRVFVYWGQVEPEPGRYDWGVVDALLDQLDGSEEVWVTVCSSSPWATRQPTTFLPPSPAKDLDAYGEFVRRLVLHCAGRVRYWQCDNEPSNVGLLWAGSAEEYLAQLRVMHRAVRAADPEAVVVLGGAPYGLPASAPDSPERQFFDVLLAGGGDSFDVFDLHLYGETGRIPTDVAAVRELMRAHGYEKPVVVGEFNGPWPNLYPEAVAALGEVMAAAFSAGPSDGDAPDSAAAPGGDGAAGGRTPEQAAMAMLYDRMDSLPPTLQMFMAGCSPELEALRHRINRREIVMRCVLALSVGVRRMLCWNLAPEVPNYTDPLSVMDLMFGKLVLMGYDGAELRRRHPSGEAFALTAERLAGVEEVVRVDVPGRPGVFAFDVRRGGRGPLWVVWEQRDPVTGEEQPAVDVDLPWPAARARAVDALGDEQPVDVGNGRVRLPVSLTPVFVSDQDG